MRNLVSSRGNTLSLIGWLLICAPVVCNEWILEKAFSSDGVLEVDSKVMIWFFDGVLVLMGSILISYRKLISSIAVTRRFSQSHPRTLAISIGAVCLVFILLGAEGAAYTLNKYHRSNKIVVTSFVTGTSLTTPLIVDDKNLGHRSPHNLQATTILKVDGKVIYTVSYCTDEYGRRLTPLTNSAQRNKFALFFGCTVTFGDGVKPNETLPYYFGELASQHRPYNYGVMGYGPQGMLAKLQSEDIAKELDEANGILIYIFRDDHFRRAVGSLQVCEIGGYYMPFYTIDSDNRLIRRGNFTSGRPIVALLYHIVGGSQIAKYLDIDWPRRIGDGEIRLTARIIEEARNSFRNKFKSDDFYALFFPGAMNAKRMIPYFEIAKLRYLDYSGLFDATSPKFHIEDDIHPNSTAYRTVAARLAKDIGISDVNDHNYR